MAITSAKYRNELCPELNVPAGSTNFIVSKPVPLSNWDRNEFVSFFEACNVVLGDGEEILVQLEEMVDGTEWCAVGEVTCVDVDQDGRYGIKLSNGVELEALVLPLSNPIRLVATTGPNSSFTIKNGITQIARA